MMIDQVKESFRSNIRGGFLCIVFSLGAAFAIYRFSLFASLGGDVFMVFAAVALVFLFGLWLVVTAPAPRVRIHLTDKDLIVQPDQLDADQVRIELAYLNRITAADFMPDTRTKLTFYAVGAKISVTSHNFTHDVDSIVSLISARLAAMGKTLRKKPRRVMSGYHESWEVTDLTPVTG